MMRHTRLDQLAVMYAAVTGASPAEAYSAIISTPTGQAIADGDPTLLYEQQTSNLCDIAAELPPDVRAQFTKEKIRLSMKAIQYPQYPPPGSPIKFPSRPQYKTAMRHKLLQTQRKRLQRSAHERLKIKSLLKERGV